MSTQTGIATSPCRWCGCYHTGTCSLVKALEFYPDGSIKRVEFHALRPVDLVEAARICSPTPTVTPNVTGLLPHTWTSTVQISGGSAWLEHPCYDDLWIAHPT